MENNYNKDMLIKNLQEKNLVYSDLVEKLILLLVKNKVDVKVIAKETEDYIKQIEKLIQEGNLIFEQIQKH